MALWCFATLDAFFSAREINSGLAPLLDSANPRVAAILNLLTKGWGYFYLGKRGEGIGVFVALLVAEGGVRSLHGRPLFIASTIAEVVMVFLCVHAYHLGWSQLREKLEGNLPSRPAEGFSVGLPMACAAFVASAYVALILIGLILPSYTPIDQSRASISDKVGMVQYANPKYGVSLQFPAGWQVSHDEPNQFVIGVRPGGGCVVQFLAEPQLPLIPISQTFKELSKQLTAKGQAFDVERTTNIGRMAAQEVTFRHMLENDGEIDQSYAVARKGLSLFIVITSTNPDVRPKCEALSDEIKSSARF
jgi:hypothetical protein